MAAQVSVDWDQLVAELQKWHSFGESLRAVEKQHESALVATTRLLPIGNERLSSVGDFFQLFVERNKIFYILIQHIFNHRKRLDIFAGL